MKLRVLVLALASVAAPSKALAADDFCSRLILQAVQQFCQLLPSGLNLCQPVAVMGPGPECKSPEKQGLVRVPLAAPTLQFPYGAPPPAANFSYSPPPYAAPAPLPPMALGVPPAQVARTDPAPATSPPQIPAMELPARQEAAPTAPAAQVVVDVAQSVQTPPAASVVTPATTEGLVKPDAAPAAPATQTVADVAQGVQTPPAASVVTPAPAEGLVKPDAAPAPAAQVVADVARDVQTPPAGPTTTPTADAAAPALELTAVTSPAMGTEAPKVADTPVLHAAPLTPPTSPPAEVVTTAAGADHAAPAIPSVETPAAPVDPVPARPVATAQTTPPTLVPAVVDQPQASASTQDIDALAHFDFDSAELTPAGRNALDAWIALAPKRKTVRITGYADRLGPEPYNLKLSLRRAQAVKVYLADKGVNGRVVQLEARGEADPVIRCKGGSNPATKACLAPNRRAQVELE